MWNLYISAREAEHLRYQQLISRGYNLVIIMNNNFYEPTNKPSGMNYYLKIIIYLHVSYMENFICNLIFKLDWI